VNQDTIAGWETGRHSPALRYIPRILEFLGYLPSTPQLTPESSVEARLKAYRTIRGLSQKSLARQRGIDPSTLARWEAGSNTPTLAVMAYLEKLAGDDL